MAPDRIGYLTRRTALKTFGAGGMVTLAGCTGGSGGDEGEPESEPETETESSPEPEGTALVDEVVDFALTSDDWAGPFGFVILRLHRALVNGADVYYIQTDVSDRDRASDEGLVAVPKLAELIDADLTTPVYRFDNGADDQPDVLTTEPGQPDYTPARRLHRVVWEDEPRVLSSADEVTAAADDGELEIEPTDAVYNLAVVKWSDGELAADTDDRSQYLGPGQLLEPPDTEAMEVTFKLHQCFPSTRYIVTDTSFEPAAETMSVVHSPGLKGSTGADATGRTNVFANGFDGPGPMGFQPSVFDEVAGSTEWSPYWTHWTYEWTDDTEPRVLRTEEEIWEARDAGELIEHPGTPPSPDTFVVNCQVPVLGEVIFEA